MAYVGKLDAGKVYGAGPGGEIGGVTVGGGGGGFTLYPLDANDVIYWPLTDTTGTQANEGTLSSYPAAGVAGNISTLRYGVRGAGTDCWSLVSTRVAGPESVAGANLVNDLSFSAWVNFQRSGQTWLFYKAYATGNGWSPPYLTVGASLETNGTLTFHAAQTGPTYSSVSLANVAVDPYNWTHVGISYSTSDGIVKLYSDGQLAYTSAPFLAGQNLAWGNGAWSFGTDPAGGSGTGMRIRGYRVCDVVRPASWFLGAYESERGY